DGRCSQPAPTRTSAGCCAALRRASVWAAPRRPPPADPALDRMSLRCDHRSVLDFDELATVDDPAWPELDGLFAASPVPLTVLPVDTGEARRSLLQLQVTARSVLGAVALNSGGL